MKGKKDKAVSHYRDAVDKAQKNGFLQDQALSNELASLYFDSIGDTAQERVHRENAIRCYLEWGAKAKVEQLQSGTSVVMSFGWHRSWVARNKSTVN